MPLNSSGPISLGGSTTGESINLELGKSATAQVSLNDSDVRTLAQVVSGAIVMPTDFWGKALFDYAIFLIDKPNGYIDNMLFVDTDGYILVSDRLNLAKLSNTSSLNGSSVPVKSVSNAADTWGGGYSGDIKFLSANSSDFVAGVNLTSENTAGISRFKFNRSNYSQVQASNTSSNSICAGIEYEGINFYSLIHQENQTKSELTKWSDAAPGSIIYQKTISIAASYTSNNRGLAVDSSNNIYVSAGDFLGKFYSNGTLQWQKSGVSDLTIEASSGGVAGVKSSSLYFFDTSGVASWGISFSNSWGSVNVTDVSFDSSGNVYVCVYITGGTKGYISLIKFNSSGTFQWDRYIGVKNSSNSSDVGVSTPRLQIGPKDSIHLVFKETSFNDSILVMLPSDGSGTQNNVVIPDSSSSAKFYVNYQTNFQYSGSDYNLSRSTLSFSTTNSSTTISNTGITWNSKTLSTGGSFGGIHTGNTSFL